MGEQAVGAVPPRPHLDSAVLLQARTSLPGAARGPWCTSQACTHPTSPGLVAQWPTSDRFTMARAGPASWAFHLPVQVV